MIVTTFTADLHKRRQAPIVADELGSLFNKLPMLSALSERTLPERFEHIRGIRDLIDCRLTPIGETSGYYTGEDAPVTACPITGEPLDGSKPFVVVRTTGWILSQKAVDQLGVDALQAEYGPYSEDDLIRIAPDEDEAVELQLKMQRRRADAKARRKEDKRKKRQDVSDAAVADQVAKKPRPESTRVQPKRTAMPQPVSEAARIAKVAAQQAQDERAKSENLNSLFRDSTASQPESASKLFIATAANRYYLN